MSLPEFLNPEYFGEGFEAIYVVFGFMALFLLFSLIALIIIFYHRSIVIINARRKVKLQKRYSEIITLYLFDKTESSDYYKGLFRQKDYLGKFHRGVLQEVLLLFYRDFTGESREKLRQLYYDFGFDEYALQKLHSDEWYKQAEATHEIAMMDIKELAQDVEALTGHSNPLVRAEARASYFRLSDFSDISFIVNAGKPMTEWEQVKILSMLLNAHIANPRVPKFRKGLTSSNESVVLFCTRLTGYFNQYDAVSDVKKLLNHKSSQVRIAAIDALVNLKAGDAAPLLAERLQASGKAPEISRKEKIHIVKAIGELGDAGTVPLLSATASAEDKEYNFALKKALEKLEKN